MVYFRSERQILACRCPPSCVHCCGGRFGSHLHWRARHHGNQPPMRKHCSGKWPILFGIILPWVKQYQFQIPHARPWPESQRRPLRLLRQVGRHLACARITCARKFRFIGRFMHLRKGLPAQGKCIFDLLIALACVALMIAGGAFRAIISA